MEFNRNQFFFLGAVILFIGLQVRVVSAYVSERRCDSIFGRTDLFLGFGPRASARFVH